MVTTAALIVAAASVLYVLASWKPAHYAPARLTQEQKEAAAYRFVNTVITPVNNRLGEGEPFSLTLWEKDVNAYLASMDEIYALQPDRPGKSHIGRVYREMEKAGLADPAVSFRDGVVSLMVRSKQYDKILSAGVSFEFVSSGKEIRVHLSSVRVGRLPIPRVIIRGILDDFKVRQDSAGDGNQDVEGEPFGGGAGVSSAQIGRMLVNVLASIDGDPLPAEHRLRRWLLVRIEQIDVAEGRLTLKINPIRRQDE